MFGFVYDIVVDINHYILTLFLNEERINDLYKIIEEYKLIIYKYLTLPYKLEEVDNEITKMESDIMSEIYKKEQ